jgi:CheY-like chemotaxis protein
MLSEIGYTVLEARDGLEALELVARGAGGLDLALVDMVMPGASGPEVIALLREKVPGLRCLHMSGYSDMPAPGDAGAAAGLLRKPFTREDLASALAATLAAAGT